MQIKVECYSGYRSEETPRRIYILKRKIEIIKIQDRWVSPGHRYFKVLGDDDAVYTLSQDSRTWEWDLTFHSAAKISSLKTVMVIKNYQTKVPKTVKH